MSACIWINRTFQGGTWTNRQLAASAACPEAYLVFANLRHFTPRSHLPPLLLPLSFLLSLLSPSPLFSASRSRRECLELEPSGGALVWAPPGSLVLRLAPPNLQRATGWSGWAERWPRLQSRSTRDEERRGERRQGPASCRGLVSRHAAAGSSSPPPLASLRSCRLWASFRAASPRFQQAIYTIENLGFTPL